MDPDAEAGQAASKIVQTTFITLVFTACHSFQTETSTSVATIRFTLPDSVTEKSMTVSSPQKKKKKKTLYLTFDDGPNKGSRKVMHIAEQEQVHISMFIIGEHVYGSGEQTATYDSMVKCDFVEVNNHSFTHANNRFGNFYSRPGDAVKDFFRCADSLRLVNNIIRTPGRNIWRTKTITSTDIKKSSIAADSLQHAGFTAIGWDLEWHYDSELILKNSGDELLQQVDSLFIRGKTKTPDHLVLLAHDQVYEDAADSLILHAFIKKLKTADEYNFEFISKYPGIKN
ncbi:MAG: polysaccharide deacetylase family protein [Ferruginibacter sp.]|nr:polysaccharide deacetylase family protein [Ferruginibacter sp.]